MPVLDTEFLFGIREADAKHRLVKAILEAFEALLKERERAKVPVAALFELMVVCLSKGKPVRIVAESLRLIDEVLRAYGVKLLEFTPGQLARGLAIRESLEIGLFDSLVAGAALEYDGVVVSDDEHFLKVEGLRRVTLSDYLGWLKAQRST